MSGAKSQSAPVNSAKASVQGLKSMTGYAEARASEHGWSLRVAIRSVNHRFLDLHLRVPDGFERFESGIRQMVRERVRRGHLDITVQHERTGPAAIGVDAEVAAAYLEAVNSLRKRFNIQAEPDLAAVLRLPGVIGVSTASLEEEISCLETTVSRCMREALDKLDHMRAQEANALLEEMSARLEHLASLSSGIERLAERMQPAFARRLEKRLKQLLSEAQIDPGRLAQEAAIAAERSDISEELIRLKSHVQQFQMLLAGSSEAGKKLDFLLQEMQREANTLLSKTPGIEDEGLEITQLALDIKSEIEKLREQAQNVE